MQKSNRAPRPRAGRRGERGAALVMTLLISALLLAAGGSLIFSTMMSATGAIEATPEQQAYYAAESGLQAALTVLRGNVAPSPALSAGQTIDFRRALTLADSNDTAAGDTTAWSRLSRWLQYDYPATAALVARDRIVLGDPATYSPLTGTAYGIEITDPYNQASLAFSTDGAFSPPNVNANLTVTTSADQKTFTVTEVATGDRVTLSYVPRAATTLASAYPSVASDLGAVTITGAVGTIDFDSGDFTKAAILRIRVEQTSPWSSSDYIDGTLSGAVSVSAAGVLTSTLRLTYLTEPVVIADSAKYTLTSVSSGTTPPIYHVSLSAASNTMAATALAGEPKYVLVTSTGYGPRGARKQLQMMVSRSSIMIDAPAAIVAAGCPGITFDMGSSNSSVFTGLGSRPAVAVSPCNHTAAQNTVNGLNNQGSGTQVRPTTVGQLGTDTRQPYFLQTPDAARAFLAELRATAMPTGADTATDRYFTTKPAASNMGASGVPQLTFIDNYGGAAVTLGTGMQGKGLLVVTGDVDTDGGTSFEGVILVMGKGKMTRSGGGSGVMAGSIIISCFNPNDPDADTFCGPTYDATGGGNGTIKFDPDAVANAMKFAGRGILGVVEN